MVKPPQHQRLVTRPQPAAKRKPVQHQRLTDLLLTNQRVVKPPKHLVTKPLMAVKRESMHQR